MPTLTVDRELGLPRVNVGGSLKKKVSPYVQIRALVEVPPAVEPVVEWGSGFYWADGNIVLTAAHVVTAMGQGRPVSIRVDFRARGRKRPVHVWTKAVSWPSGWSHNDVAVLHLHRMPTVTRKLEIATWPESLPFTAKLIGYDPDYNTRVRGIKVTGARTSDSWLSYDKTQDHPGFSGGPLGVPNTQRVFGVHSGGWPLRDQSGYQYRAWSIRRQPLSELVEVLA